MDILRRLSGWTDGMSNADVYKLAHDEIESLRAKLAEREGFVPVPVEPTTEMIIKGAEALDVRPSGAAIIYKAMINAAMKEAKQWRY